VSRSADRQARRERRKRSPLETLPFRPLENPLPPVEMLSPEQEQRIHEASMQILEQFGLDFIDAEALAIFEAAGARVDHAAQHVWLDRGLVLEAIAKAPASFTLHARNPARNLTVGGRHINFLPCLGTPFVSDLDKGRRPGTLAACEDLIRLVQLCTPLHGAGGYICTPQDLPVPVRHLEMDRAQYRLSDRTTISPAYNRGVADDCIAMAAIIFGGENKLRQQAVLTSLVNVNSPLRYDSGMTSSLIAYARAGQPLIVTPFILAGAMSPISMAGAVAQQNAEALAGIALTQLVNPGVPVIYGSFTTNTDMATGGPAFGTPESAWGTFAGAQLARRYRLPYRNSGGLTTSKLADAQAAYETQMCLWPNVMSHTNYVLHAAGWLEGGLVASFEKLIIDVEQLAMFQHLLGGAEISDATLALDSIREVGPGGHHFGTAHTIARYASEFFLPIVADRQNIGAWQDAGAMDAARRAYNIWTELLASYEPPPLDPGVAEALNEFVARRRRELGHPA
jgi:trimethylamine--corrinoid protein Co-methyltransferase